MPPCFDSGPRERKGQDHGGGLGWWTNKKAIDLDQVTWFQDLGKIITLQDLQKEPHVLFLYIYIWFIYFQIGWLNHLVEPWWEKYLEEMIINLTWQSVQMGWFPTTRWGPQIEFWPPKKVGWKNPSETHLFIRPLILLMAEILHHLGCMKPYK